MLTGLCSSSLAKVLIAAALAPTPGGGEVVVPWTRPVAYASADAGVVLAVEGSSVRWRAPPVCAPAVATLTLQSDDGLEEALVLEVIPAQRADAPFLVVVARGADWEVQAASNVPLDFHATAGTLEPAPPVGSCQRRTWILPPATRPDIAAVAAFEGPKLHAWTALTRAGATFVDAERARPGSKVTIIVAGRRFVGISSAGERRTKVRVLVPPGVERATGIVGKKTIEVALNPPSVPLEYRVSTRDGARWLFLTAVSGVPRDEDEGARPGAEHVALGVYRFPPPSRPASDRGAPASERTPEAHPIHPVLEPARVSMSAQPRAQPDYWRLGAGVATGPSFAPGVALRADRSLRMSDWAHVGGGLLLVTSGSRHSAAEASNDTTRFVGTVGPFVEAAWTPWLAAVPLRFSVGVGGALSWRRVSIQSLPPLDRLEWGPLGTAAVQAALPPLDVELRVVVAAARLGLDTASVLYMTTVGWRWGG